MLICSSLSASGTCCMRTALCAPALSEQLLWSPSALKNLLPVLHIKYVGLRASFSWEMYEMTSGKLLPRLANESSHNCQNPEDSALQNQRKTKTSTTVAPRSRREPSSCNTRPHTGKHSHATAVPECTAVGVGCVLPERQLSGAASCSFLRLAKNRMVTLKSIPPAGSI